MNWYCIHTRPQKEDSICRFYEDSLHLETFSPQLRERRVIRRVKRLVTRPLFPRYVFCRFEPALHHRAVRYAPDIIDVLHFGGEPTIVPDALIDEIRGWNSEVMDTSLRPAFFPGDIVVIGEGPLMGLRAIVQHELNDTDRVAVLLSFLDCGARTVLPRAQLQLVG